jgi:hypothetical protein
LVCTSYQQSAIAHGYVDSVDDVRATFIDMCSNGTGAQCRSYFVVLSLNGYATHAIFDDHNKRRFMFMDYITYQGVTQDVAEQESGAQESETHVMIRDISTDLRRIQQGLHDHINVLHNRLQEQQRHFYELNCQMHEKIDWLVSQQNNNELFNCNASIGGGSSAFNFDEEGKKDEHDNSRDGSKVGKTTEILKNRRGPQLRSTPKRSTGQDNTTHEPPAKSQSKKKSDQVQYYSSFTDRRRGEPAAVNVGANAGLKNSNVYCYSNAILQCLASCISLSDFSPSENHPEFELNHAFACLMTSMVGGEQSIDPSSFMDVFRPLFRPPVEEEGEVNTDEQEGMYYDFAWTTC